MLQIGSLVDNKYKILSEIGHGGMSVVYLAMNERANKTWAVKEVRKDGTCDFEAVKQGLVVETDMLKKLNHPHLPSIIDVIDTDDSFLIVMDYIEGKSLQSVLRNSGAQSTDMVIDWGKQLCDVLGYLHGQNPPIIYRDMKPANVMLKPDNTITLIDFGTAREFKNRSMVEDTTCLGTRGYAAPEQFGGRGQTDARTDIYCLGATLYHLITGHSPAEPPYEIKPLSYWDPSFAGSGLEKIIAKCCQQDPEARYQTCADLLYDLEHVGEIDNETIKKRNRRWNAFIGSIALCAVGVVGMITCGLLKGNAQRSTYEALIAELEQSRASASITEFTAQVKEAVEVDPSRYEAYDLLVSYIENDGRFDTATEFDPLVTVLQNKAKGQRENNEDVLLDADPENYADIQFRIGKLLFLMSPNDQGELSKSTAYFHKALNKGGMAESTDPEVQKKAKFANALYTIASQIGQLGAQSSLFTENETYGYEQLWTDMKGLYENNSIDDMGRPSYGIALYNWIAAVLVDEYDEILNVDITTAEMNQLLDDMEATLVQVKADLTQSELKSGMGEQADKAIEMIEAARRSISAVKGGAA